MTVSRWLPMHVVTLAAGLCLAGAMNLTQALAQGLQPGSATPLPTARGWAEPKPAATPASAKPSAAVPMALPQTMSQAAPVSRGGRSLFDEPAAPAKVQVTGKDLVIEASNASLSDVIRQVAEQTGMQVEGNSHDQRVFGSYGPGDAPDVLSALLYDSGYNVLMVGNTPDGAPRRLVLSPRPTVAAATPTVQAANREDEDDESPTEPQPPPPPSPGPAAGVGVVAPGQPKTPQQMLEELQRMHQGEQPQEMPRSPQ